MYIIEISLKFTPMFLSVQLKELQDAQEAYAKVVEAMRTGKPSVLELRCEHQENKQLTIATSEISAVQVYDKSGAAMTTKRPGFFVES